MKRRMCTLLALMMVLCEGIACAQRAVPDFCAFSLGLVHDRTDKKHEDTQDSRRRYYEGTSDSIELAAQEYVQLLQDEYGFRLTDSYEVSESGGFAYKSFGLQSEQPENDAIHFSVGNSTQGWRIDNCDIFVQYWKSLKGERQGVTCYINDEYVFEELGDYSKQALAKQGNVTEAAKATAVPAAVSIQSCSICGGDGKITKSCTSCGGDKYVSTELICRSCNGKGERRCGSCNGIGYKMCSVCYGSGSTTCWPCLGSGLVDDHFSNAWYSKRICPSCGGARKLTHEFCAGTGKNSCTSCDGSGSKRCIICSGTGHRQVECTSCNGSGMEHNDCTACGGDGRI